MWYSSKSKIRFDLWNGQIRFRIASAWHQWSVKSNQNLQRKRKRGKNRQHTSETARIPSPLGPNPCSILVDKSLFLSWSHQENHITQLSRKPRLRGRLTRTDLQLGVGDGDRPHRSKRVRGLACHRPARDSARQRARGRRPTGRSWGEEGEPEGAMMALREEESHPSHSLVLESLCVLERRI